MGHCFCEFPINLGEQLKWLHLPIGGCSLAIFFMASGFLFSTNENWATFFKKKTKRLLIPYLVFCVLTIALRMIFSNVTHSGAPGPLEALLAIATGGYYWFLYALFIIMALCRLLKKQEWLITVALLSTALFCLNLATPLIITRLLKFFPFFVLGMLTRTYYQKIQTFGARHLSIFLSIYLVIVYCCDIQQPLWMLLGNLLGCCAVWTASVLIGKRCKSKLLSFFGRYSLQFYLNHLLVMLPFYYAAAFLPVSAIFQWLFIFVGATAISYIMLLIEQRVKWIAFLCGIPTRRS